MLAMRTNLYLIAPFCSMGLLKMFFSFERKKIYSCIESSDDCWVAFDFYKQIFFSLELSNFQVQETPQ